VENVRPRSDDKIESGATLDMKSDRLHVTRLRRASLSSMAPYQAEGETPLWNRWKQGSSGCRSGHHFVPVVPVPGTLVRAIGGRCNAIRSPLKGLHKTNDMNRLHGVERAVAYPAASEA